MTPEAELARVLVVDADPALYDLLEEWLADAGWHLVEDRPDLVVVDLPLAREQGARRLRELRTRHPGKPLVALSSTFFAGVQANGAVARSLGVQAALAKPLERQALLGALRELLPQRG